MFATRQTAHHHVEDRSYQLITASTICLAIAAIGIVIRCSARKWIFRTFALDDWLMIISFVGDPRLFPKQQADGWLLIDVIYCAGRIRDPYGTTRSGKAQSISGQSYFEQTLQIHLYFRDLLQHCDTSGQDRFHLYVVAWSLFYIQPLTLLTVFYLRILRENTLVAHSERALQNSKRLLWALFGFIVIFGIILECLFIFQCSPISHTWTLFIGSKGHCLTEKTLVTATYFHSAVNGTLDLLLAILPVPFFWRMELGWRMKLSVIGVLCIGAL